MRIIALSDEEDSHEGPIKCAKLGQAEGVLDTLKFCQLGNVRDNRAKQNEGKSHARVGRPNTGEDTHLVCLVGNTVVDDGPSQGHSLAHASRQLGGHQLLHPTQPHCCQALGNLPLHTQFLPMVTTADSEDFKLLGRVVVTTRSRHLHGLNNTTVAINKSDLPDTILRGPQCASLFFQTIIKILSPRR